MRRYFAAECKVEANSKVVVMFPKSPTFTDDAAAAAAASSSLTSPSAVSNGYQLCIWNDECV
jgi:hypothetical protein